MAREKSKSNTDVTSREMIYCTGCDHDKKPSEFYKSYGATKSGVLPYCKDCCIKMSLNDNGTLNIDKFKILAELIPKEYKFEKRTHKDSKDEFNNMLNYCFGILYSKIEKALIIAGLDPFIGGIHSTFYNNKSLVYDFIENFRFESSFFKIF